MINENWNPVWEEIFSSREWGKYPELFVVRCIARNFYKVQNRHAIKILDLGCGPGANLWYIAREGFNTFGIDGSPSAIKILQKRLDAEKLTASLHIGDISNLPFEDNFFDAVIDSECLYCNQKAASQKIISEVHRVIKPAGLFFSLTFAPDTWGCNDCLSTEGHYLPSVSEGPLESKGGCE